jgi:hypothetical protein
LSQPQKGWPIVLGPAANDTSRSTGSDPEAAKKLASAQDLLAKTKAAIAQKKGELATAEAKLVDLDRSIASASSAPAVRTDSADVDKMYVRSKSSQSSAYVS